MWEATANLYRDGDADQSLELSWQAAKSAAQQHIDRLQLTREQVFGKRLDLHELFADHHSTGRFRVMVLQAADRILVNRGGHTNITDLDIKAHRSPDQQ